MQTASCEGYICNNAQQISMDFSQNQKQREEMQSTDII